MFPTSKALGPLTSAGVWAPSPCATAGLMLVFPEVKFVGSDSEVSMSHCGLLRTGSVLSLIFSGLCNQASCGIITSPLATPAHQWTTLVLSWTASIAKERFPRSSAPTCTLHVTFLCVGDQHARAALAD